MSDDRFRVMAARLSDDAKAIVVVAYAVGAVHEGEHATIGLDGVDYVLPRTGTDLAEYLVENDEWCRDLFNDTRAALADGRTPPWLTRES